ncbi:type VII secretion-associated serine protease mycosin [Streptomyces sp. SKN60]|uniref:type VII secretion-associated serine protease mycosin n=1 Tax=Streptomyces sp. SKN60 TaxID=2855506 RepID=UPI002247906F|nr:type VII secretion-associated serine protease mycosin [Streptomyces sp. SKN60]MCX2184867.1 type VII secretion-associated serine protease mycosin [Streptomyces sp. SKN60]
MRTSSVRRSRGRTAASAALGVLLVGMAAFPAYAESVRSRQWHLDTLGAEEVWRISKGEGVTVAVVDTGVDENHPDLVGRVLDGMDLAPKERGDEHTDYDGHGTGMAGIIAGTGKGGGGDGAFGLAPGTKILPVRVPRPDQSKSLKDSNDQVNRTVSQAIRFSADSGARVISISLGATEGSQELTDAVKYALDKDALVFASVGNSGDKANKVEYPGATPGVVGVGAIDKKLMPLKNSQTGPQVDIVAPGAKILHACGGKTGLCDSTGTSDATALASATAALIWSEHPEWTNNQVLRVMLNTIKQPAGGEQRNDSVGYGAIRPLRALKTPGDPGPADVRPIPDLTAEQTSSSSPSAAPTPAKPAPAPAPQADDAGAGSSTGLWIGLGVGAAVLLGAAVAVPLVRSRRS